MTRAHCNQLAASLKLIYARNSSLTSTSLTVRMADGQVPAFDSANTAPITPSQTFAIKSKFKVSKVSVAR